MSCHLYVEDFAVGGLHDPSTGKCRDPTCQWLFVSRHPRKTSKDSPGIYLFLLDLNCKLLIRISLNNLSFVFFVVFVSCCLSVLV